MKSSNQNEIETRKLNQNEIKNIEEDMKGFLEYMRGKGWSTTKIDGVKLLVGKNMRGGGGKTFEENGQQFNVLREDIINNDEKRARVLYHELGHILLGIRNNNKQSIDKIKELIVYTREDNSKVLQEESIVYLDGLKLIEEYLVEKFSIGMLQITKGVQPQVKEYTAPIIFGDYKFKSTFGSLYGVFETLCDKLILKAYGNIGNAIKTGLDNGLYTGLFEKYDKVELMKILGNFGKIKNAIYSFAGYGRDKEQYTRQYTPEEVKKLIEDTEVMIDKIQVKGVQHPGNSGR